MNPHLSDFLLQLFRTLDGLASSRWPGSQVLFVSVGTHSLLILLKLNKKQKKILLASDFAETEKNILF
jgi:hypothetical protein